MIESTKEASPKLSEAQEEKSFSINSEVQNIDSLHLKDKEVSENLKQSENKKEEQGLYFFFKFSFSF